MTDSRLASEIYARELLDLLNINSIPIDPYEICKSLGIDIFYEPLNHCEALLLIKNGTKRIILNENSDYQARYKFALAHEIGHYYIPHHAIKVYKCHPAEIILFQSNKSEEHEANLFASNLLMPTQFLKKDANRHDFNADAIKLLSDKYGVSLTAAAIRFLETTPDKAAIVISQNGSIKWFKKSRNFKYYLKTRSINENTYLFDFYNEGIRDETLHSTNADAWIEDKYDGDFINEQSLLMPNLKMALTVLTIPFSEDDESDLEY